MALVKAVAVFCLFVVVSRKNALSFHAINDFTYCFSDVGFNLGDVSSVCLFQSLRCQFLSISISGAVSLSIAWFQAVWIARVCMSVVLLRHWCAVGSMLRVSVHNGHRQLKCSWENDDS